MLDDDATLIAMPHQDTNANEADDFVSSEGANGGPCVADGGAVVAPAEVRLGGEATTAMDGDETTIRR